MCTQKVEEDAFSVVFINGWIRRTTFSSQLCIGKRLTVDGFRQIYTYITFLFTSQVIKSSQYGGGRAVVTARTIKAGNYACEYVSAEPKVTTTVEYDEPDQRQADDGITSVKHIAGPAAWKNGDRGRFPGNRLNF